MKRSGIEYFPMPVNLSIKFKVLEAKYGSIIYAIYIKILQTIYQDEGYYLLCDEDFYIIFSDNVKCEIDKVKNIINDLVNKNFFDKELYEEHSILTSNDIQFAYINAVKRRKSFDMVPEFCLDYAREFFNIKKNNENSTNYSIVTKQQTEKELFLKLANKIGKTNMAKSNLQEENDTKSSDFGQSDLWEKQAKTAKMYAEIDKVNKSKENKSKENKSKANARPGGCYCDESGSDGEQKIKNQKECVGESSEQKNINKNFNNLNVDNVCDEILKNRERMVQQRINAQYGNSYYYRQQQQQKNSIVRGRHYTPEELKSFFTNIDDVKL